MTDQEKIEILKARIQKGESELLRIRQLRPLITDADGWSRPISFEQMSEYAIKWMEQEALFE